MFFHICDNRTQNLTQVVSLHLSLFPTHCNPLVFYHNIDLRLTHFYFNDANNRTLIFPFSQFNGFSCGSNCSFLSFFYPLPVSCNYHTVLLFWNLSFPKSLQPFPSFFLNCSWPLFMDGFFLSPVLPWEKCPAIHSPCIQWWSWLACLPSKVQRHNSNIINVTSSEDTKANIYKYI